MKRILVLALIVLPILAQCTRAKPARNPGSENFPEQANQNTKKIVPVQTMELELQSFSDFLDITGTVHARNHIEIVVEEGGILKNIQIDKGTYVTQGDVLAVLENRTLEANYKAAQASLHQAELDYTSKKVLFDKKAISENEFLTSQYNLEAVQAALELTKARYDKLSIAAPGKGLVNNRYYDLGAYVNPLTPIFELIDEEYVIIRAGVAERFLGNVRIGTPVEIIFDAYPDLEVEAEISFISRRIDPEDRTFRIEMEFKNPDLKLFPQMIANIRVRHQEFSNRIVIPLDSLMQSEEGWFVFVENDGRAKRIDVQKVAIHEDRVLVDGLSPGQNIVTVGHQDLSDGDFIEVVES
jgi:membrane fusion protein (multidrug efflux system)